MWLGRRPTGGAARRQDGAELKIGDAIPACVTIFGMTF